MTFAVKLFNTKLKVKPQPRQVTITKELRFPSILGFTLSRKVFIRMPVRAADAFAKEAAKEDVRPSDLTPEDRLTMGRDFENVFGKSHRLFDFHKDWMDSNGKLVGMIWGPNKIVIGEDLEKRYSLKVGDQATTVAPDGRRMIITATPLGIVVVFDQLQKSGETRPRNEFQYYAGRTLRESKMLRDSIDSVEELRRIIGHAGGLNIGQLIGSLCGALNIGPIIR